MFLKSTKHKTNIENIRTHRDSIYLYEMLNRFIGIMKTFNIRECPKTFKHFKILTNSLITQLLLEMIPTILNHISFQDITFVVFL